MNEGEISGVLRGFLARGERLRVEAVAGGLPVRGRQTARPQGRAPRSVAQLMDDVGELPPMLIDGLLPDRSLFLLAGKPKAGKSFLALDIADSVCRGGAALGRYRVNRPGPVMYVGMEDGEIEIVKRLKQRGVREGDSRRLYYITDSFILTDAENLAEFRRDLERMAPSLIVIDTAAEALGIRDWLNRSEIIEKVAPIRQLAREVCSVLLVAHNRKADGDGGDEIAGSNAFAGAVDGWISTQRVERMPSGNRRMFLRIEGRGGVRGEIAVEMDTETLGFSVVSAEGPDVGESGAQAESVSASRLLRRAQVMQVTREHADGATLVEIAEACSVSKTTAWKVVRELVDSGEVEEVKRQVRHGRSGREAVGFRIVGYAR